MTMFAEVLPLRQYQADAIQQLRDTIRNGACRPLLVLPTGGGKTVIAAEIMRRHVAQGGRALFLAPRRELITQASEKLAAAGLDHGILLAGAGGLRDLYAPAQVASIDTAVSRLRRRTVMPPELIGISLVIVDEAHLAVTPRRRALLDQWPDAIRIGLTATPTRKDGAALGVLFDTLVEPTTTAQLTADGYLAPARYFSISEPDLRRVTIVAGDFNAGQLEAVMNQPHLVGDVVSTWLSRAADRRTIVFCTSVAHSVAMAEAFQRVGVAAEHVDGTMETPMREQIIARYRRGDTQVLTNCFIASFGFDAPETACIVLARPTKSLMLHLQMIGRGLRIAGDKANCLVLDHAANIHRHGFAADARAWTLDGARALREPRDNTTTLADRKQIDCPECSAIFAGTRTCPECGFYLAPRGRMVEALDGELVEIGAHLPRDELDRAVFFCELRGYATTRRYKPGWAAHQFRYRYGVWPDRAWDRLPAATPTLATARWVKGMAIRWAKSRRMMA